MSEFCLVYGNQRIPYAVRVQPKRATRRVAIHVEPDGRVIVDVPPETSPARIKAAVTKRVRWIYRQVSEARLRLAHVLPREYVSGEALLYLGRRYRLKVILDPHAVTGVRSVCLRGAFLEVTVREKNPSGIRDALDQWYLQRAKSVFGDRLVALAPSLRWVRAIPVVRLRAMKRQWGSCSPAGRLTLNPHLVKASRECVDYVLFHELCHIREHNHSKRFFSMLDAHMPGWRATKEKLDNLAEVVLNI